MQNEIVVAVILVCLCQENVHHKTFLLLDQWHPLIFLDSWLRAVYWGQFRFLSLKHWALIQSVVFSFNWYQETCYYGLVMWSGCFWESLTSWVWAAQVKVEENWLPKFSDFHIYVMAGLSLHPHTHAHNSHINKYKIAIEIILIIYSQQHQKSNRDSPQ